MTHAGSRDRSRSLSWEFREIGATRGYTVVLFLNKSARRTGSGEEMRRKRDREAGGRAFRHLRRRRDKGAETSKEMREERERNYRKRKRREREKGDGSGGDAADAERKEGRTDRPTE